ncbi:thymidylate synthase [Vibrio phage Vp_R1]|uniref:Thymidylate synthase n=1 Tax=Vibrio phage Vp_R1 TaxID=2059867 RepID=A0A2H5BPY4_9CAUD|nr:thymidylate synthase [Vibrio phage Vp_R1]AUG88393.1 thymidylate synthase [Vibrio phage Vp_R1]
MHAIYLDHMGSDNSIANTARISMTEAAEFWHSLPEGYDEEKRDRLLNFLARENHWTPFGHPQITLQMNAPVPIRTQCFKSKVGFVENEESRRYISSRPTYYIPEFRTKPEGSIKQGSGGLHPDNDFLKEDYEKYVEECIRKYEDYLEKGVAPEQARFLLPQGCEVNWIWTGSLSAYARFVRLRKDSHAQGEIQILAKDIDLILEEIFPQSWKVLMEY